MFRRLQDLDLTGVTVFIDGKPVRADEGESVAAVLLRQDPLPTRTTTILGSPRGPYCMMGVCFDCLATVDARTSVQTCLTVVRDGMWIERQLGRPDVSR